MNDRKKKSFYPNLIFWVIALLLIGVCTISGYLWYSIYFVSPQLNYILLERNQKRVQLLSSKTYFFSPYDKIRILKISTNIPFNLFIRLVTSLPDIDAFRYEEIALASLFSDQEIFNINQFRISIKYQNKEIGYFNWEVKPTIDDWLKKVNQIIDKKKRMAFLERGITLFPNEDEFKYWLLNEYKRSKQWSHAASIMEELLEEDPDFSQLFELLELYTTYNNRSGIISVYKRMLQQDPENLEIRQQLAETFAKGNKFKNAIKEYLNLMKQVDNKDCLPVYQQLGYLYSKSGSIRKAITFYLKAAKLNPQDANLYYNIAYLYERLSNKKKAQIHLAKALELKPDDIENRINLAHDLIDQGKLKKAEKYLKEIIKKRPTDLIPLQLLAKIKEKQGKKIELKGIYKRLFALDAKNKTVIYNLGALEYESGNLKASLLYFTKYVKLSPNDVSAHGILFDIYTSQNKFQSAFKEAKLIIKLSPNNIKIYHFIFNYLKKKNDYEKIFRIFIIGVKENPSSIDLKEYLVLACLKTGREDLAIIQMNNIQKLKPRDTKLLLRLAKLYEKNDNLEAALQAYKNILKLVSDHEEAEESYLRLRLRGVCEKGAIK